MLNEAGVQYHVVELDAMNVDGFTGVEVQTALATATGTLANENLCYYGGYTIGLSKFFCAAAGRRTVPNVFIKKESIGGGTDVQALFQSGKLMDMLRSAGAL